MKRGRLTERIEALAPVSVKNDFGETTTEWESRGVWYAQRLSYSGKLMEQASELFSDYSASFAIDFNHAIHDGWRVRYDSMLFGVEAVEPNRKRGMKTLRCNRINP